MLTRRTSIAAISVACLSGAVAFGCGTAHATTPQDDAFLSIVKQLNVPMPNPDDAITVGRGICTAMDAGRVEPAPTVRGIVSSLTSKGLEKSQAIGLLRGAVSVYCPQYRALVAR